MKLAGHRSEPTRRIARRFQRLGGVVPLAREPRDRPLAREQERRWLGRMAGGEWSQRAGGLVVLLAGVLGCSSRGGAEAPQAAVLDEPASCLDAVPATDVGLPDATSGRLAPETIRDVIRGRHPELEGCYQLGFAQHSRLEGKVTFVFAIAVDGTVDDLRVADNSMPDCGVVRCMRDVMAQSQFPPPQGGSVSVSYPLTFAPAQTVGSP